MNNLKYYKEGMVKLNRSYDFVMDGNHKTQEEKYTEHKEFDRPGYYFEYYKNLTPSDFEINREGDKIIIKVPDRSSP